MGESFVIHEGDCRNVLKTLTSESIDSCVTDPPYELGFMGKKWDGTGIANNIEVWAEVLRVLKPGAHLLAFGGTRTYHRMVCAIEDAGFEIRDQIGWLYGSGFPKSLDVSKAIDKAAGIQAVQRGDGDRETTIALGDGLKNRCLTCNKPFFSASPYQCPKPGAVTDTAKQWEGWGTALKPAWEPIVVARKPFTGTVAENVQKFGTGAINVDACRVRFQSEADEAESKTKNAHGDFKSGPMSNEIFGVFAKDRTNYNPPGRWPANIIHDGSEEVMAEFAKYGDRRAGNHPAKRNTGFWTDKPAQDLEQRATAPGTAARFFYCAKASQSDRNEGLNGFETKVKDAEYRQPTGNAMVDRIHGCGVKRANHHPTVKPTALMRYLCRLVTPPGGVVLDCFTGSGSTGRGALLEGFQFIGIEQDAEYIAIAKARIEAALASVNLDEPLELFAHIS